ncbi:MAG: hypothetical protein J5808_03605 [Paludibacteraceae bacterium]|nr:hypothetical protein [Paludibacteraceae bacterium]
MIITLVGVIVPMLSAAAAKKKARQQPKIIDQIEFYGNIQDKKYQFKIEKTANNRDTVWLYVEEDFSNLIFTEPYLDSLYNEIKVQLPSKYHKHTLQIISRGHLLQDYVPNILRSQPDSSRLPNFAKPWAPPIEKLGRKAVPEGLQDRQIALWPSHGLYLDRNNGRWCWQRPRLFGTVEDLYSTSVVLPYLLPMLEDAGAEVHLPRERDVNPYRMVVEPHRKGPRTTATVTMPEPGNYWVSVWYSQPEDSAVSILARIEHGGVASEYKIHPQVGAGTWIYLDQLWLNPTAKITFTPSNGKGKSFAIDSVKVGGGMSREGNGYPRYSEAALYWLKDAGLPDSIVYDQKKGVKSDYYDDIFSRSKWVNFLAGGSEVYPDYPGLSIPVDASLAFHTDAGVCAFDSVVGTLILCTTDTIYPVGYSQLAGTDFAESVRSEIIRDLRSVVKPDWATRGIWHRKYVETRVPACPALIVEMLSHQSFADLRYGFDPQFKFLAARAIYKGTLKFLAQQYGEPYCVTPLPVENFATSLMGDSVRLSWRPREDTLEVTAQPDAYMVYTRIGRGAFDNGVLVSDTVVTLPLQADSIVSYQVRAVNRGGRSFPSEILSVCRLSEERIGKALVINAFDRLSGPKVFDYGESIGFDYEADFGVPYLMETAYTGRQYETDSTQVYVDNDYPGFGASTSEYEKSPMGGNTYDYAYVHGEALRSCGYSFASCSKSAVMESPDILCAYRMADVIMGKQRNDNGFELMPRQLWAALADFVRMNHGSMLVSGAYIGSDADGLTESLLHARRQAPWATRSGVVVDCDYQPVGQLQMTPTVSRYHLQSVDAMRPIDRYGRVLLRYDDSQLPAAVGYDRQWRSVAAGFPLEAITDARQRAAVMKLFVEFLNQ